jgi:hypothetical protein
MSSKIDLCQIFLEEHNSEIESITLIKMLYRSAKFKLAFKNFHVAWILMSKAQIYFK